MLLSQIDSLTAQIERLDSRVEQLLADIPAAQAAPGVDTGDGDLTPQYLSAVERPDEITVVGRHAAQVIIAEVGLSMAVFPTCGHPVSWVKLSPRTIQSGAATRTGRAGKGNHYLKAVLGEAAAVAGRGNSFLGARYRRPAKRVGRLRALVAVSRSILHFPRPAERGLAFLSIARTHGHMDVDRSTRPIVS